MSYRLNGEKETFMLEIIAKDSFINNECIGKETRFVLNGIEGYQSREESKYYPDAGYRRMKISWNDCTITNEDGEYDITGTIPTDEELAELSEAFDTSLYDAVKAIIQYYQS